ncbi:MAG: cardiolipin synthase, partial [Ruminiclostridium sp.]|nr:cardiolipin synthase [Ruminiclostridium sp.]
MINALTFTAKKGIETIIIVPGIPDKRFVYALTRSYYKTLLKAGVKIYEYSPGFIHSKTIVIDNE